MSTKDRVRLGTVSISRTERSYINNVLDSGFVSPGGYTKLFEKEVAAAHNKKFGLALNSGQSAIMVALEAAKHLYGIRRVAVPAITYISSVAAIIQAGLVPFLCDITADTQCEIKLPEDTEQIDAILPCHLFGRANDAARFITGKHFVCEDACESIYAKGIGMGDAICLSFYPSHTVTAGFGGMILTDNEELYFKCWQLVNHGRADWDDYTTCHTLKERFTFSEIGYSLKFSDLNAALGLAQHRRKDGILFQRKSNALYLHNELSELEDLQLPNLENHTFMMFPILVKSGQRDDLEKALNDENIETRRMMPITTQPVIRDMIGEYNCDNNYPGAKFINEHGFYVGCHQDMTEEHLDRIVGTIKKFYK